MNVSTTMNRQEQKWQAEADARHLAETHAIQSDPKRVKAAKIAAQKMMEEKKQELTGLKKVCKK